MKSQFLKYKILCKEVTVAQCAQPRLTVPSSHTGMPVQVPAIPRLIHFPDNVPGKATKDDQVLGSCHPSRSGWLWPRLVLSQSFR